MRSKRNLARFLALLMATAMLVAVLLMVAMPYVESPFGATLTEAVPLVLIAAAFLIVCAWALAKGALPMAFDARGSPSAKSVFMGDQVSMKDQRRQWARRYPTGFRQCRSIAKRGISRTAQCNLYAFNANDQNGFLRVATA